MMVVGFDFFGNRDQLLARKDMHFQKTFKTIITGYIDGRSDRARNQCGYIAYRDSKIKNSIYISSRTIQISVRNGNFNIKGC